MIAIPIDARGTRFMLIRDLNNPDVAKEEDLNGLNLMHWLDTSPPSIASLSSVLPQLRGKPFFAAFFPMELEKKLARLELAYTERRYRTRDESRIHETKFDVVVDGGAYDVRVREVYLRR
jgi:hypothetical protein